VRVKALEHFTDDAGALAIASRRAEAHLSHGIEDTAMDRFEPVASVRESALHDDADGVVEE
jgi:hypothetical protein